MIIMVDLALLQSISNLTGAIGVLAASAYYIWNIQNNNKQRRNEVVRTIIDRYSSARARAKYGHPNPVAHSRWISIFNSYGYALQLLKWNLVSEEMLKGYLGYVSMGAFWEKFGPMIKEMRVRMNQPGMGSDLEFYYNKWQRITPKGREVENKPSHQ